MINIAAVADIHYPKYANLFLEALKRIDFSKIDVMILAGDIIYKGNAKYIVNVHKAIRKYWSGPVISIFGNEEYDEVKDKITKLTSDFIWLDDEGKILKIKNIGICFIGSRGSIEKPTRWQSKNIPNILQIYKNRENKIKELISRYKSSGYYVILILHYAPTYSTLLGEKREIWPFLASRRLERIIVKLKPDLVIHAHVHNSKRNHVILEGIPIYNVSLPATNSITLITIKPNKYSSPLFSFY